MDGKAAVYFFLDTLGLGVSPQTSYNKLSAGTFPNKTRRIGRRLKSQPLEFDLTAGKGTGISPSERR
jgi:hypothetical protein